MEKHRPHHSLAEIKQLVEAGEVDFTQVALQGALSLGMFQEDILNVVCSLTSKDFYKSMTSHADHRRWQDVYHPKTDAGTIYLKLTIQNGVLILSFKEK